MERNFDSLAPDSLSDGSHAGSEFDVLVIGGGIGGAGIAWEATLRGLKVALVEQGDFGGATSSACFRIVHGGIRYLQHLDLKRVFQSANEQRILRLIAPHAVSPFPFLVPCFGKGRKSREFLGLGCGLYDKLTFWRNNGVDAGNALPHPQMLTSEEVMKYAPGLVSDKLRGGVVFYDAEIAHCERLTWEVVESAAVKGAVVVNYAQVEDYEFSSSSSQGLPALGSSSRGSSRLPADAVQAPGYNLEDQSGKPQGRRINAVKVRDLLTNRVREVRAKYVVNAAGPWIPKLNRLLPQDLQAAIPVGASKESYSQGVQVVLPNIGLRCAVALDGGERDSDAVLGRGSRSYFLLPWRGATLLGTTESVYSGSPDTWSLDFKEVEAMVKEVGGRYQSFGIRLEEVKHVFGGLRRLDGRALAKVCVGTQQLLAPPSKKDEIIDYGALSGHLGGIDNLLSSSGVKYTTFRAVAEQVVDIVERKIKGGTSASSTAKSPLVGGCFESLAELEREADSLFVGTSLEAHTRRLISDYGAKIVSVANFIRGDSRMAKFVGESKVSKAEILLAVHGEMTENFADLLLHRTSLGVLGYPGDRAFNEALALMSSELGWTSERQRAEREYAMSKYPAVNRTVWSNGLV